MALSIDERVSAAVQKLRGFILYGEPPDGTSFDAPGDGFFPPVESPSIRIYCGEILRALKGGAALPPGIDGAGLEAAVYAVKHNPAGFDRDNVGAVLARAWRVYVSHSLSAEERRRTELAARIDRVAELLAGRRGPADADAAGSSGPKTCTRPEEAAARLTGLLAGCAAGDAPAGLDLDELRRLCGLISTRAYGSDEAERIGRTFESYAAALEAAGNN